MTHTNLFYEQPVAERLLKSALANNRLATAYLFTGPTGVGKFAAGLFLAQALLCEQPREDGLACGACSACRRTLKLQHPDLHVTFPIPGSKEEERQEKLAEVCATKSSAPFAPIDFPQRPYHRMDVMRALIDELSKTPIEGRAKVVIFDRAERMEVAHQTLILKTIEEPPPDAYLILCSPDPDRLLPTVRSRCQNVRFRPVAPEIIAERLNELRDADSNRDELTRKAELAAVLSGGGWGRAVQLYDEYHDTLRETANETLQAMLSSLTEDALAAIEKLPVSSRTASDDLYYVWDCWKQSLVRAARSFLTIDTAETNATHGLGPLMADPYRALACADALERGRHALAANVNPRTATTAMILELRRTAGLTL